MGVSGVNRISTELNMYNCLNYSWQLHLKKIVNYDVEISTSLPQDPNTQVVVRAAILSILPKGCTFAIDYESWLDT